MNATTFSSDSCGGCRAYYQRWITVAMTHSPFPIELSTARNGVVKSNTNQIIVQKSFAIDIKAASKCIGYKEIFDSGVADKLWLTSPSDWSQVRCPQFFSNGNESQEWHWPKLRGLPRDYWEKHSLAEGVSWKSQIFYLCKKNNYLPTKAAVFQNLSSDE